MRAKQEAGAGALLKHRLCAAHTCCGPSSDVPVRQGSEAALLVISSLPGPGCVMFTAASALPSLWPRLIA